MRLQSQDLTSDSELPALRNLGALVQEDTAGQRIDAFLGRCYPFLSRSGWQKRISNAHIRVNGGSVKTSYKLQVGDQVQMHYPKEWEPEVDTNVQLIFQDQGIAGVMKPSGLPMHQVGKFFRQHFSAAVKELLGEEWSAVHRLDRETSGIVMCGSTNELRSKMSIDFEERRVEKTYLCIVRGQAPQKKWLVDAPIGDLKESVIRIKRWVVPDGQSAQTEFECLEQIGDLALLKAKPLTGRTNQIRVHAAYSGLPLLGDRLYHEDEAVFLHYHQNGEDEWQNEQTGASRLCLHAFSLKIKHPVTGRDCYIESPMPDDMSVVLDEARRSFASSAKHADASG